MGWNHPSDRSVENRQLEGGWQGEKQGDQLQSNCAIMARGDGGLGQSESSGGVGVRSQALMDFEGGAAGLCWQVACGVQEKGKSRERFQEGKRVGGEG